MFIIQVLYKIIMTLTKVAILLLYLRIFGVHTKFRWACIILMAFTIMAGIAFTTPTIWQCSPIKGFWDRSIPHKCIGNHAWRTIYSVLNIVTDFLIFFLPIQQIIRLQLVLRDKIAMIFIFSIGAL